MLLFLLVPFPLPLQLYFVHKKTSFYKLRKNINEKKLMRSEVKKKRTESLVFGDKILHITPYLPYICRESPPTRKDNQMVTAKTKNMEKKRNRQRRVVSEKAGYKTMIQPISIQYQARKTWIFAFWCWGVEMLECDYYIWN